MRKQRSHPPALRRRTLRTLREETSLAPGDTVVLGVSGGGDSMALLHVLANVLPQLGCQLHAHGVDHGLRPEARDELDLAQHLAEQLKVPFSRTELQLQPGGNLQARAREGRYAALDARAQQLGARWVATAHHHEDRAETLLIRLLRGTGPKGLAVLPACSTEDTPGRLRPMIRSPRDAVLKHLERNELTYATDPSNRSPRYLRTRVRQELLPLLEELAEGATDRLNRLADEMTALREDEPLDHSKLSARPRAPLHLGPVHAAQFRRAVRLNQRNAEIWLPGGQQLQLDPHTGQPCVHPRPATPNLREDSRVLGEKGAPRGGNRTKSD